MAICTQKLTRAFPLAGVVLGILTGISFVAPATTYAGFITIAEWQSAGQVTVGASRFTYVSSSNVNGDQKIAFDQIGTDYLATLNFETTNGGISAWDLKYKVDILAASYQFSGVGLSSGVSPSTSSSERVATTFTPNSGVPFTLTSINGNTAFTTGSWAGSSMMVDTHYDRGGNSGQITGVTWGFSQQDISAVPEPGSLALIGLGALGSVVATYRRKKRAKLLALSASLP